MSSISPTSLARPDQRAGAGGGTRPRPRGAFDLAAVRAAAGDYAEGLRDRDGRYGAYRTGRRGRCDLYASCDLAIMRTLLGEDLARVVPERERTEWCEHINSFANHEFGAPSDGSYGDRFGHSPLHANGMVIGALGVLGGRQAHPVSLYDAFAQPESVGPWLESLDWSGAWRASHLFWGGVHCFSFSARAGADWLDAVFGWLERNLDPATGWWRRGAALSDRHQGLGGAAHLLPLFEHHGRRFPLPERVIDSVLALQRADGRWLEPRSAAESVHVMHYLELDALYALALMRKLAPDYRRADIAAAAARYGKLVRPYYGAQARELFALHPHQVLAAIGTFGGLQQLLPDEFADDVTWTDIFSDRRLYRTSDVERLEPAGGGPA
ncbi:MAG TPA: hypothetical protein VHE61_02235 [Opitutaceae bacterium]|nr:hypothetical protein [Opitutaceae bacterium]